MPQAASGPAMGLQGLLPFIFIILIFYFILIRPQVKKEKEIERMRANLQKGDNVVTAGGICGTIVDFKGNRVILRTDEKGTTLLVLRSAISGLQESLVTEEEKESPEKSG